MRRGKQTVTQNLDASLDGNWLAIDVNEARPDDKYFHVAQAFGGKAAHVVDQRGPGEVRVSAQITNPLANRVEKFLATFFVFVEQARK